MTNALLLPFSCFMTKQMTELPQVALHAAAWSR